MVTERLTGRLGYRVVLKRERGLEGAYRAKEGVIGSSEYRVHTESCTHTGCREGPDSRCRYLDFSLKRNAAWGDRGLVTTTSCGITYRDHYI